jgi:hypothetical protein
MKHVEAVIKLFDPDYSVRSISARRKQVGNPSRHALDALRAGAQPMTVRQMTDAVMAARKITDATPKQRALLEAALRSCLETNAKRGKLVMCANHAVPKLRS